MPWITDAEQKQAAVLRILGALPDWFGISEAILQYGRESRDLPCLIVEKAGQAVGFVCVKETSACAAEVHVMGVLPAYHRQGIGRELIAACEAYCGERNLSILHVKTLDHHVGDPNYLRTYAFYRALGFLPLEVLPLWDEKNPCLLMVKTLGGMK